MGYKKLQQQQQLHYKYMYSEFKMQNMWAEFCNISNEHGCLISAQREFTVQQNEADWLI